MSRVQSILTYTIPAKTGETTPPAAPIRCGCDDLLLILEDRSLLQTALRGILRTEIKSVAVSNQPVPFVDPVSGRNIPVWKYGYTVEYNDEDLTDTSYRVRKCDVSYNCCYACGQAYTDRQLEGYVQSVAVLDTNSVDMVQAGTAQNPVLSANAKVSATVGNRISIVADGLFVGEGVSDSLVDNGNRTFTHTAVDGSVTTFCQGIQQIVGGAGCLGISATNMVRSASLNGCTLTLESAPEHTTGSNSGVQLIGPTALNPGVNGLLNQNILINNPSACREFRYFLHQTASVELDMAPLGHVFLGNSAKTYRYGPFNAPWRGTPEVTTATYGTLAPGASTISNLFVNADLIGGGVFIWGASQTIGYIGGTV